MARLPIAYRTPLRAWPDLGMDIDRFLEGFPAEARRGWRVPAASADFFETDDAYTLELEAPGFDAEDIDVHYEGGILTVSGAHRTEREDEGRTYHVRERSFERFSRAFSLPETVRADEIDAHIEDGVLTVTLPKAPDAKPKRIGVRARK